MPDKKSLDFFKDLLNTIGPSGYEEDTAAVFRKYLEKFCDRVDTDVMGNTIGVLNENAPFKVMLVGHYDEIGFQVTHITDDGYIWFRPNGGIDKLNVPSSEVEIRTANGVVHGVIGKKPIHLLSEAEREKAVKLEDMWIDIGAENREEAAALVSVGDPVALKRNVSFMGKNRVMSKGLDDRIGAFVVAETMRALAKRKLNVAVYGVGSVQEELGYRGAITSCYNINPAVGFAIDVGFASDLPDVSRKKFGDVKLGKGAMVGKSADVNVVLNREMIRIADEKKIPYQIVACHRASGGTDASAIQLIRGGAATALISIPNRYMHSPVEICDLRDVDSAVKLLTETIAGFTGNEQFRPGLD